jgi:DNA (cytosine-5)-methyltransferase 1
MWKHMARIISEVRPQYVFVENSPMLTIRGLGVVLGDLSEMGFNAEWGVISATDIGAPHLRERIWIVARNVGNTYLHGVSSSNDQQVLQRKSNWEEKNFKQLERSSTSEKPSVANSNSFQRGSMEVRRPSVDGSKECGDLRGVLAFDSGNEQKETREILAYSSSIGQQGQRQHEQPICAEESGDWKTNLLESIGRPEFWATEPNVGRVADGVAARVDRLKAIGNGQVPLCAATAWRILNEL